VAHFITRNQGKIRESGKASAASSVTLSCVSHHGIFLGRVERDLSMWLEDEAQKGLSVSGAVVKFIAMQLYSIC
jgi:hypothetical protein